MKGSFSIEAAVIVPIVVFVMIMTVKSGIALCEETQMEVQMLKEQKTEAILQMFLKEAQGIKLEAHSGKLCVSVEKSELESVENRADGNSI